MMFQWDAVDTNPDLEGQNVIKSFEMAIRHNRRTTRTELQSFFVADVLKYFSGFLMGASAPIVPYVSATGYSKRAILAGERWSSRGHLLDVCGLRVGAGDRRESCRSLGLIEDSRRTAGRTERKHRMPADVD